jgi:hypothetical protein
MFLNQDEITVSKVEMAKIQLDAAIAAYFDRRLIASITLAGAAEEVFGAMLQRDCIQNSVEKIASLPPLLAIFDKQEDRINFLNNVRNNLKHASDKLEDDFIVAELDAFFMIARALGNSELIDIPDTLAMKAFRSIYTSKA